MRFREFAGLLALALILAACGTDGTDGASPPEDDQAEQRTDDEAEQPASGATGAEDPIRIGFSAALTGFASSGGDQFVRGLEIWRDMINESTGLYEGREPPGLLGRQVELIYADDESSPDQALSYYERLTTRENVDLIAPPYGSTAVAAVSPVTEREGYVLIGASAASPSVYERGLDFLVQASAPADVWLAGLPELMNEAGYTTASLLTREDPATIAMSDGVIRDFEEHGFEVLTKDDFDPDTSDFTSELLRVRAADPDVVIINSFGDNGATIMRQAAELGVNPRLWAATSMRDTIFIEPLGNLADCVVRDHQWAPELNYAGAEELREEWTNRYGEFENVGDVAPAWGFVVGQLLALTVDELGEAALERPQTAMKDFFKTNELETVLGPLSVDPETGKATTLSTALNQVQDGKGVLVWDPVEGYHGNLEYPCVPFAER